MVRATGPGAAAPRRGTGRFPSMACTRRYVHVRTIIIMYNNIYYYVSMICICIRMYIILCACALRFADLSSAYVAT